MNCFKKSGAQKLTFSYCVMILGYITICVLRIWRLQKASVFFRTYKFQY